MESFNYSEKMVMLNKIVVEGGICLGTLTYISLQKGVKGGLGTGYKRHSRLRFTSGESRKALIGVYQKVNVRRTMLLPYLFSGPGQGVSKSVK